MRSDRMPKRRAVDVKARLLKWHAKRGWTFGSGFGLDELMRYRREIKEGKRAYRR